MGTKGNFLRKKKGSAPTGLVWNQHQLNQHQHGGRFIVLGNQYGGRDVI